MIGPISNLEAFFDGKREISISGNEINFTVKDSEHEKDSIITFTVGNDTVFVNNHAYSLGYPVEKVNNEIYFPIKDFLRIKGQVISTHRFDGGYIEFEEKEKKLKIAERIYFK